MIQKPLFNEDWDTIAPDPDIATTNSEDFAVPEVTETPEFQTNPSTYAYIKKWATETKEELGALACDALINFYSVLDEELQKANRLSRHISYEKSVLIGAFKNQSEEIHKYYMQENWPTIYGSMNGFLEMVYDHRSSTFPEAVFLSKVMRKHRVIIRFKLTGEAEVGLFQNPEVGEDVDYNAFLDEVYSLMASDSEKVD